MGDWEKYWQHVGQTAVAIPDVQRFPANWGGKRQLTGKIA